MSRPAILIVTPTLADANNGNWQTAQRYARFLAPFFQVELAKSFDGQAADLMLALHARRSAASVQAWHRQRPGRPQLLVLTGTDLYQDIAADPQAQSSLALASLEIADALIVLNQLGLRALPTNLRAKASVCLQSCSTRQTLVKSGRHLRALMVGHLREVKSPQTYFDAAARLSERPDIRLDHIGGALEPALGSAAQALAQRCPAYRWLGALSHEQTRRRIQAAHVLVHASRLEGGAHVVIEALCSGTPVLASRIDGNVGLLGEDYLGLFDWNDAAGLASLLKQCRDDPAMLAALGKQAAERAALFHPDQEKLRLLGIVESLLSPKPQTHTE